MIIRIVRTVLCVLATSLGVGAIAGAQPVRPGVPAGATALAPAASDSVVRLAVDPSRAAGLPYVTLLDDLHYRVERDGRSTQRARQVVQVLDGNAVRALSERVLSHASSHQSLRIEWVRVLRINGEVISDRAAQEQESDVPAAMANPVYADQKVRRLSLAGVAAGTIIDMAWTIEERAPPRAGDFLLRWAFNGTIPVARSRLVVDAPDGFTPKFVERNVRAPLVQRDEEVRDGRRIWRWSAEGVESFRPERFASDSNPIAMAVTVAAPGTWSDIARWYDGLARDRYTLSASDAARVDAVVRASNARTRADTIRAVHRLAAQDIRYVSVALGIGGYQPRRPSETLATGFGDCKDKTTLFVAALRRYGMDASPVLLASSGRPDRSVPSIFQFNHAIAAVRHAGVTTFTDLTAELVPYGTLPTAYQGAFGLLVLPDGRSEEVSFPVAPISDNIYTTRVRMTVDSSGRVVAHVNEDASGSLASALRTAFAAPVEGDARATLLRGLASRAFASDARADSLVAFNGRDLDAPVRISFRAVADNALRSVGTSRLLPVSGAIAAPGRSFKALARELEGQPRRQFPIDASAIVPAGISLTELSITLPPGWEAELPKNVLATTFFGSYQSTWTTNGREVRLVRRVQGGRGIVPSERIAEVIVWLNAVGSDDYDFLSLRPAPVR
ncbi:MAG TPA: DUF3857 domain-containing transglutaminase family protein [Gemmatimonas sp.]|nr:DUF3857 domain-containing transglutaminase family protein [Gemmatimonas sp.]